MNVNDPFVNTLDFSREFITRGFGQAFLYQDYSGIEKIGQGNAVEGIDFVSKEITHQMKLYARAEYHRNESIWPIFDISVVINTSVGPIRYTKMLIHSSYLETAL